MEVCWVTIAQAHLSNLRGMLKYPTSRFPPLQRSSSDSTTFDPLRAFSFSPFLSSSLSLFLSIIPYTLSPSRSIAFCVVSILVRLSPIFPSSIFPFLLWWKIFSSPLSARVLRVISLDFVFVSSRRLSRRFFSATSSLLSYSPLWRDAFSLSFDHNSRLTNIVNTPSHLKKTFGPGNLCLVKFHLKKMKLTQANIRIQKGVHIFIIICHCPLPSAVFLFLTLSQTVISITLSWGCSSICFRAWNFYRFY